MLLVLSALGVGVSISLIAERPLHHFVLQQGYTAMESARKFLGIAPSR
jgi:hypothetical protein